MQIKFSGVHRIVGTIYSDMNCDEALRKIYAHITESKRTKKLNSYFSIVANYCYILDNSSTKTFNSIENKYLDILWNEALIEIFNKLPKTYHIFPVEVAISIIVDTCRQVDNLKDYEYEL